MTREVYDLGNGQIYGVMGGDAIMNAHRQEEKQARREAIMKERGQNDNSRRTHNGNNTDKSSRSNRNGNDAEKSISVLCV